MRYALFGYDFPHMKTNDFISALKLLGVDLRCILAAPKVKLNIPQSQIRTSVRRQVCFHPRDIAKFFGIPYFVTAHNSEECVGIIKREKIDVGIIGGARVLSKEVINAFSYGVINFHPGLLPENRGLDNLKWAIYLGIPQFVTSHFIGEHVDAGRVILSKKIEIYFDDTLFDVQERLYGTQLEVMEPTLKAIQGKSIDDFELVTGGTLRSMMPADLERKIPEMFEKYKRKHGVEMREG